MTLDELKEYLASVCQGAIFDTDEETGEIVINSRLRENDHGNLEEMEDDIDPNIDMHWATDLTSLEGE